MYSVIFIDNNFPKSVVIAYFDHVWVFLFYQNSTCISWFFKCNFPSMNWIYCSWNFVVALNSHDVSFVACFNHFLYEVVADGEFIPEHESKLQLLFFILSDSVYICVYSIELPVPVLERCEFSKIIRLQLLISILSQVVLEWSNIRCDSNYIICAFIIVELLFMIEFSFWCFKINAKIFLKVFLLEWTLFD